ncbi:MAG: Rrf2 family transcriptional regulator [Desulfobacterota bacterium]|nr:Rrf2 family transcriptional regulator [Thermodesulfobacteriota bacterium]
MKLSTKMRYGTRIMVELAAAYSRKTVSLKELAQDQQLSLKYLEHIMAALKASGLIKTERGIYGGYSLSREPNLIRLIDLYQALEGKLLLLDCLENPSHCPINQECPSRDIWCKINDGIKKVLERTTVQDLLEKKRKRLRKLSNS